MKRNIFWMIWGVASLVCVMVAGFKSFAIEAEQNRTAERPAYISVDNETKSQR